MSEKQPQKPAHPTPPTPAPAQPVVAPIGGREVQAGYKGASAVKKPTELPPPPPKK